MFGERRYVLIIGNAKNVVAIGKRNQESRNYGSHDHVIITSTCASSAVSSKRQNLLETNGSQDMLLLEIQVGAASEPPIYMLNLYNAPINSHHSGKAAELSMKSQSLMSNRVLIGGDLNLHHID